MVFRAILTGITAVGQTGGVLAMAEAVFVPTQAPAVRKRDASRVWRPPAESPRARGTTELVVTPIAAGDQGLGLGLSGTF